MKLSGYMTARNPLQMEYPIEASIRSLFDVCDEIIICDSSDREDGTRELLDNLRKEFAALGKGSFEIVTPQFVDWDAPNHGIYDGLTKAFAREACTGDVCLQLDADEVLSDNFKKDYVLKLFNKVFNLHLEQGGTKQNFVLSLPVVEPWGSSGKIRCDVNPWKERLSFNVPEITHGIPKHLKTYKDGRLYALPKTTDGCNMINRDLETPIPVTQVQQYIPKARGGMSLEQINEVQVRSAYDAESNVQYQAWLESITSLVPFIWHYSWFDIASKIRKYKNFWAGSWDSLYGETNQNPPGFPFFHKPWSEVTEEDIREAAEKLESECGGHIFHSYWRGQKTKYVSLSKTIPKI